MLMRRTENKSVKNIYADRCLRSRYYLRENRPMNRNKYTTLITSITLPTLLYSCSNHFFMMSDANVESFATLYFYNKFY